NGAAGEGSAMSSPTTLPLGSASASRKEPFTGYVAASTSAGTRQPVIPFACAVYDRVVLMACVSAVVGETRTPVRSTALTVTCQKTPKSSIQLAPSTSGRMYRRYVPGCCGAWMVNWNHETWFGPT